MVTSVAIISAAGLAAYGGVSAAAKPQPPVVHGAAAFRDGPASSWCRGGVGGPLTGTAREQSIDLRGRRAAAAGMRQYLPVAVIEVSEAGIA